MTTKVDSDGGAGIARATGNVPGVLRAADRRRLERAVARREKADRDLRALVRELRDRDSTVIELAGALGMTRQGVYKMLRERP